ncbi:MAG: esterase-like activity of phytase family protein [Planctomycetota bacterium]|nr:esterase-like activity of phytase family protein [Planctomycetota bacterium]
MRPAQPVRSSRPGLALVGLCYLALILPGAGAGVEAEVKLVGVASLPAMAADLSGLTDTLPDGTPHNRLGSFGSAIAYTGRGHRYIAAADRGPANGEVAYKCRVQMFDIDVNIDADPKADVAHAVTIKLVATTMLVNEKGENFVGISSAFDASNSPAGLRLDPEGIRVNRTGGLFIADEYGPFVLEFSPEGKRTRVLSVPAIFSIKKPAADKKEEIALNDSGRMANKGFEGLAISPDGSKLFALLQQPLLQDHGTAGVNCRLLELDAKSGGATRQIVCPLDDAANNFNELLAVNDHEFLAIERDSKIGAKASFKRIITVDTAGASDVGKVASLPEGKLPEGIVAAKKGPFIDLLDPRHGLAGPTFPEKIEGLAFGPDLPDGRHLLIVTVDNDFLAAQPSRIYVFAIDPADLPGFQPQAFDAPR